MDDETMGEVQEEEPPTPEQVHAFVVAAHGNLPRVREMLTVQPSLIYARHHWSETDSETAIQAAAQTGSVPVVEYLLERGAPLEITTAAMLGRKDVVERMLTDDPGLIQARGAHGITLMAHAAMGGNIDLVKMLYEGGATAGASHALGNAVMHGDARMARWLLENAKPDTSWKSYEGKSLMTIAKGTGKKEMVDLMTEFHIS